MSVYQGTAVTKRHINDVMLASAAAGPRGGAGPTHFHSRNTTHELTHSSQARATLHPPRRAAARTEPSDSTPLPARTVGRMANGRDGSRGRRGAARSVSKQ